MKQPQTVGVNMNTCLTHLGCDTSSVNEMRISLYEIHVSVSGTKKQNVHVHSHHLLQLWDNVDINKI